MDNLELMKQLPDQCINLIYCDILYNTGKSFDDYDDNLGTPQEAMVWYEPRLLEMKRILKDTGSIYLQCDYRLVHYLKVKMDEIFGFDNFRNDIIWKRDSVGKGAKKSSKQWSRELDNILFYSKSNNIIFHQQYKTNSELGHTQLKEFRYADPDGRKFKIVTLGDYSQDSIEAIRKQNLIYKTSTGKEYKKYYLDEFKLAVGSLWDDIPNLSHGKNPENIGYDTQKPKKLLERIIKASSNEGDLVADFFCGSGTTCVVAKELGRDYLGCDINPKAIDITYERLYNNFEVS
jgi:DNA modification methylase